VEEVVEIEPHLHDPLVCHDGEVVGFGESSERWAKVSCR
jgi:hypothetical protein